LVGSIYGRPSVKIAHLDNLYRGPSIYASYQVSIHLAKPFQRFLEIDQPETITAYGYSISEVKIFKPLDQMNLIW
jgi:hypothetical protein